MLILVGMSGTKGGPHPYNTYFMEEDLFYKDLMSTICTQVRSKGGGGGVENPLAIDKISRALTPRDP